MVERRARTFEHCNQNSVLDDTLSVRFENRAPMANGLVKRDDQTEWHRMSYRPASLQVIFVYEPPDVVSLIWGAAINVKLESGKELTGIGGNGGKISRLRPQDRLVVMTSGQSYVPNALPGAAEIPSLPPDLGHGVRPAHVRSDNHQNDTSFLSGVQSNMKTVVKSKFRFDTGRMVAKVSEGALANILASAEETVGQLQCPKHGTRVSLSIDEMPSGARALNICGCCEKFEKDAAKIIKQEWQTPKRASLFSSLHP